MKRVYVTLDFVCNNDCVMCANTDEERNKDYRLATQEVKDYLTGLGLKDGDIVEFSGGEPTIRKDILELCKYFKENCKGELAILTNGRRMADPAFADEIARYINRTVTAFYAPDPVLHDTVTRKKGSFDDAFRGVKNMEERGVRVGIKTIPTKLTYRQLPQFVDFAFDNFKNPTVFFSGLDLRGQACTNQDEVAVRFSDVAPFLEAAIDRAAERGKTAYIFTMPMCSIDPFYWNNYSMCMDEISKDIEFLIPGKESKKDKGLLLDKPSEDCHVCEMENRCFWGWKGYVERFGSSEFKAYKEIDGVLMQEKDRKPAEQ